MKTRYSASRLDNAELGYIKLFRSIIEWEWYKDPYVMRVFLHCLLVASSKNYFCRVLYVKKGSFWTSRRRLAQALDISEYRVRQALKKLEETGEISCHSTCNGVCISIVNWNFYQCEALRTTVEKGDRGWSL